MQRDGAAAAAPVQLDEDASAASSSPGLSTPPRSPDNITLDPPRPLGPSSHHLVHPGLGGALPATLAPTTSPATDGAASTTATAAATPASAPAKKPRKKREPSGNVDADGEPREKKPRKPREPKDPNAPPKPRKKQKTADAAHDEKLARQHAASRQPRIADLVGSDPVQPPAPQQSAARTSAGNAEAAGNRLGLPHAAPASAPSTPRPISSGQHFDPIRSATIGAAPAHNASGAPAVSPSPRPVNRASASPSITSLIDPPPVTSSVAATQAPTPSHPALMSAPPLPVPASVSPTIQIAKPSPPASISVPAQSQQPSTIGTPLAVEMDLDKEPSPRPSSLVRKPDPASAGSSSKPPTPPAKPARQKEAPPLLPTGTGLLSGMPFGGAAPAANGANGAFGTNIWLTFPLRGQNNVTINFAREVEKKYGFAALHPRLAARNERRRQMAAAGAALENAAGGGGGGGGGSADDMSLDLSEPESNAEVGGAGDEASAGSEQKARRRRKKAEEYDRNDDFIDDTETAWEEQALMAKDGFFVYSGPLVTEGEKPAVERYVDVFIPHLRGQTQSARAIPPPRTPHRPLSLPPISTVPNNPPGPTAR